MIQITKFVCVCKMWVYSHDHLDLFTDRPILFYSLTWYHSKAFMYAQVIISLKELSSPQQFIKADLTQE